MTELQVLRWFENPEPPEDEDYDSLICKYCKEVECGCVDDWKVID